MTRERFESDTDVTITLDIDSLLRRGGYLGGDDDDGPHYAHGLVDEITARAANSVVGQLMKDQAFRAQLNEVIESRLITVVDAALAEPVQETDSFGHATGETMPLRNLLAQKVTKTMGDWMTARPNYGKTKFAEYLDTQVDRIVRQDLGKTLEAARKQVQAAVVAQAAEMVAAAAAKIQAAGR